MMRVLKWTGTVLLWLVVILCLAVTIVPRFLDRIYYRGVVSDHFDGARFFNTDDAGDDRQMPGGRSRGRFIWGQATGQDGRPDWPTSVAVAQSKPPARVMGDEMLVTWIGHATVLVQAGGLNILTDPIYAERAGPFGVFGPQRVTRPGVAFDDLPPIDLVLVSHNHYDHLDKPTLQKLWERDRPLVVTSLGNDSVIAQAGVPSVALDWGERLQRMAACETEGGCPTIDVVVNRNHHWGSRWFADRNRALWSSFVVTLPGGNLFFAGDTGAGDYGWADEARNYGPIRLALMPIGAFRFVPGQMGTATHIGPVDAVELFRRMGASRGIGIHWGTYRLSSEAYDTPPRLLDAVTACAGLPKPIDTIAIGIPARIAVAGDQRVAPETDRDAIMACLDTDAVRAMR